MSDFASYVRAHVLRRDADALELRKRACRARQDAEAAAKRLGDVFPVSRVILFGSLATGRFQDHSDVDLAIEGLADGDLVRAHRLVAEQSEFDFNLVPMECASVELRQAIDRDGVQLWPR